MKLSPTDPYVLTFTFNDYGQTGEYFIAVFLGKPDLLALYNVMKEKFKFSSVMDSLIGLTTLLETGELEGDPISYQLTKTTPLPHIGA